MPDTAKVFGTSSAHAADLKIANRTILLGFSLRQVHRVRSNSVLSSYIQLARQRKQPKFMVDLLASCGFALRTSLFFSKKIVKDNSLNLYLAFGVRK